MPTLTLTLKNKFLGKYKLQKGVSLTIGRRESNDIVIEDPAVSGHHAKIDSLEDRFVLTDLQSKNGSFVNEQLVHSHWLKDEDVITIGGYSLVLHFDAKEKKRADDSDKFDETQAINTAQHRKMMIKSNPTKSINVVGFWERSQNRGQVKDVNPPERAPGDDSQKSEPVGLLDDLTGGIGQLKLTHKITTIGKDPTSDIVVKGLLMNPTAATINKAPEGFTFNYIGGLPKPKINDKPVNKATLLKASDIIQIGSMRLQFSIEGQQKGSGFTVQRFRIEHIWWPLLADSSKLIYPQISPVNSLRPVLHLSVSASQISTGQAPTPQILGKIFQRRGARGANIPDRYLSAGGVFPSCPRKAGIQALSLRRACPCEDRAGHPKINFWLPASAGMTRSNLENSPALKIFKHCIPAEKNITHKR